MNSVSRLTYKMQKIINSELRKLFDAGVTSVLPQTLIRKSVNYDPETEVMTLGNKDFNLQNKRMYIVGIGKAVLYMAKEIELIFGSKITKGIISVPAGSIDTKIVGGKINYFEGAVNNLPDAKAESTAKKIKELVQKLNQNDVLIVLISGGGSALLPLPHETITLEDKLNIIKKMGCAGADIKELNSVRKKLSSLKGGKLALLAQPAHVFALILSDIVGDPLDCIASGPTVNDCDSPMKAIEVLKKYNLYNNLSHKIKDVLMDSNKCKEYPCNNVINYVVGSNKLSIEATVTQANQIGYYPIEISSQVTGYTKLISGEYIKLVSIICKLLENKLSPTLARDELENINIPGMKKNFIKEIINNKKEVCLVLGGETTVKVKGNGKGGRNQQLALEFSRMLHHTRNEFVDFEIYCLCAGTDGIDGPTDAAGAIGYKDLVNDAAIEGLNIDTFLENNDSYTFYERFKNGAFHIITGHTNTNVMDINIIIIKRKSLCHK